MACSRGFLSANIIYGEVQAGADNLIGLGLGTAPLRRCRRWRLEALDESVLPPTTTQVGCQAFNGGSYSLVANFPAALASRANLTGDPLKLEAPTGDDFFGFVGGYLIQVLQTAQAA